MIHPEVTTLYKYRAFNEQSLSILINKKVWFASPDSFNDPFDCGCKPSFKKFISKHFAEKGKTPTSEEIKKAINKIEKDFDLDSKLKQFPLGIFSLTETCLDIAMWSHYAESHKGFCIGFVRDKSNILGLSGNTKQVNYVKEGAYIEYSSEQQFVDEFFYKKSKEHWSYEKEWRCIVYPRGPEDDVANREWDLPGEMESIIFGLKMPDEHKRTIINILKDDEVNYYRVEKDEKYFKLNIFPLTKEEVESLQKG